jgi:ADP-dependent NAD(P)H-hydrate dehydratase
MPKSRRSKSRATKITRALLRRSPIPAPSSDDDKDARGRVLVIGGELSLPGAVVLAGIAALRAGAGKLQIATCRSIAPLIGVAVPESLSLGLDETAEGTISANAAEALTSLIANTDALLIGPGMKGKGEEAEFISNVLSMSAITTVILDAGALYSLERDSSVLHRFDGRAIITPHAKEMARILNIDVSEIRENPERIAAEAASNLRAVVALKGAETYIASPEGEIFCYDSGDVGLATSGSGDTLAGVVAGLIARGASPVDAAMWAVFLHGAAGNRLARRVGRVGYLARELLDEIPALMRSL